jgi:hypothetical protein
MQSWNGGGFMGWPGWEHFMGDLNPPKENVMSAYFASDEVMKKFSATCGCGKGR